MSYRARVTQVLETKQQQQTAKATERAYWLAWSRIDGVGPVTIKRLWEHFGILAAAWQASAGELLAVDGIGLLSAEKIVAQRGRCDVAVLLTQHEKENQAFWTPADPDYPALLFAIPDPPPVLYYRGQLRLNEPRYALSVGMVGTRRPSAYGQRWTQQLSSQLTREGATIISGLATGIDTLAHSSCLQQQGKTVAVLGTGVDVVYPQRNRGLYQQIVETGLAVSEYPDGTLPHKANFPRRNRIIAGLSRATLVTEAPARSGALITARLANDYGRDVYALPCGLDNATGAGCLGLIDQGAQIILSDRTLITALHALPVIHAAAPSSPPSEPPSALPRLEPSRPELSRPELSPPDPVTPEPPAPNSPAPHLSDRLTQVLNAVPPAPTPLDQVVQGVQDEQLNTGDVLGALTELELLGLISQLPGMQYQRA